MSDTKNNNYSGDSIEETRKKKMEEFKRSFDKSVMNNDYDEPQKVHEYSDETSYRGYSSSSSPLKRKKSNEINSYSDSDTKKRIEKESQKALKQQSKEDKRIEKNKAKRNQKMFKWVWLTMVVLVAIVLSQVIMVGVNDLLAIEREKDPKVAQISIPADPSIEQIAEILEDNGVIDSAKYFTLYANITTEAEYFRQGNFEIETDKDYEAIINFLQSNINRTDIVTVQLTEGMNVLEIATKLHEEGVTSDVQEFLDMCNSDNFDEEFEFLKNMEDKDKRYYKLEGYLFPDTYDFYLNEDPESTIYKLLNNYENKVYYEEEKYYGGSKTTIEELVKDSDYSLDEIIIIASIIQAEAANEEDMYYISSVLHNRLENGVEMGVAQLNCDCTVYYPYREYKDIPESIRGTYKSTYDTNTFIGLPAGPICNPSKTAILAAISPYETDYYFFCHATTDDGSVPYYASTIEGHEYNLSLIE
ncbi:MAG: endolytic transglycosylase MltG [Ruminococcus sp.]|nr:endolytic transglycosylase MltG [Ruminococcus sp.]